MKGFLVRKARPVTQATRSRTEQNQGSCVTPYEMMYTTLVLELATNILSVASS
jgi:hypothetical protein